nr:hypothetical protein [Leptospira ilyithenensis]
MFSIGLQFSKDKKTILDKNLALFAIILNLILIPGIAYLLIQVFQLEDVYQIAILLCAISPGGTSGAIFIIKSKGDPFLGGILILGLNTIGSIFIPIIVSLSLNLNAEDSYLIILKLLSIGIGIQGLPLLFGVLVRNKLDINHSVWSHKLNQFANLLLLFCILSLSIENYRHLLEISWDVTLTILILTSIASNSGLLFYKLPMNLQSAISAVTGIRNLTIALVLAEFLWDDSAISLGIMIYGALMYIVAYLNSIFWRKKITV